MARMVITVDGREYPCRPTMGAMLRFRRETGREVTQMDGSLEDLCTYLWCCVCSAARREGVEFDMTLMDFADHMDPQALELWARQAGAQDGGGEEPRDEKKTSASSTHSDKP